MDVAAEYGVNSVSFGITDNRVLKFADKIDCIFHPLLRIGAERPIAQTEPAPDEVDQRIERKQELIAKIAGKGEPARVLHNSIQFMPMND